MELVTQSYFPVPKDVRLNTRHFFILNTPEKQEIQQIASDHSFDIGFIYGSIQKVYSQKYSFLIIDTTLPLHNASKFQKSLSEEVKRVIMTTNDKIRDKILQYDINTTAAKTW